MSARAGRRSRSAGGDGAREREGPSTLSRWVAAASGAVVLALVLYLMLHALGRPAPAAVVARVVDAASRPDGAYVVSVEVRNTGEATAKEVQVETVLEPDGGGEPITAETVVDYLAGGERRRVYAILHQDPRRGRLATRVLGYQEP